MCGIAGVWCYEAGTEPDLRALPSMCDAMAHRGPDATGSWQSTDGRVGLGFRRLAIIDLSETGHQPMSLEDAGLHLVFNGEIYNFRRLRASLEAAGVRFRGHSDTEVLLALAAHRDDWLGQLSGMFGLGLWDERHRRLTLARDRVGEKPLFWHDDGRRIVFASELPALLRDPSVPRALDLDAVGEYLQLGYVASPRTVLQGVHKVPPGHVLVHDGQGPQIRRYWDWRPDFDAPALRNEEDSLALLRDRLREVVRDRMVADVPLGAFLSGGLDSSTIVALMAEVSDQPVRTFSVGFAGAASSELPKARLVAEAFGTRHEELIVEPGAIADVMPGIAAMLGEPFADSSALPTWYVARMARRHVTVALSGDGGDEALAGYVRYRNAMAEARVDRVPQALRRPAAAVPSWLVGEHGRLRRVLDRAGGTRMDRYAAALALSNPAQVQRLLGRPVAPARAVQEAWADGAGLDPLSRMQYVDLRVYLPEDILVKVDRMAMAHSVETRAPFLDHDWLALAARVPTSVRMDGGTKMILRRMMAGRLPAAVLDAPKQGFSIPGHDWLRGDAQEFFREVILGSPLAGSLYVREEAVRLLEGLRAPGSVAWARAWALGMLALWHSQVLLSAGAAGDGAGGGQAGTGRSPGG